MPQPKVSIAGISGDLARVTPDGLLKVDIAGGASIDIGDVEILGHTSIGHGVNTSVSDSTAEQLTHSDTPCKHVDIMAAVTNSGYIAVGGEEVAEGAAEGVFLYAGDVYSIDIDNVNKIYVIASVDTEDVSWTYFN